MGLILGGSHCIVQYWYQLGTLYMEIQHSCYTFQLVQGSPSESEVKEDDDISDNSDFREDGQRDGASPQPPVGSGAKRKRKKKKKRGRVRVPASSEDPTDVSIFPLYLCFLL